MVKYEFAIAVADKSDVGHKRKKEGDVIAVKPQGWKWGTKEVKEYLIVEIDLPFSAIQKVRLLQIPLYDTGQGWYPDENQDPQPKIIGKRKYKIPFVNLGSKALVEGITIDFQKVANEDIEYQPIEKTTLNYDNLIWDNANNKYLTATAIASIEE